MADIPHSSFIPREAGGMTPGRVRRTRVFHVFGFIAAVLLIGSLITAGGVFFLKKTAQSKLEEAKTSLNDQKDLFKVEQIAEVREFDRRLQAASLLVQNHISPLKIFDALEKHTKQKVQLTSFELEHTPTQEVIVSLTGETSEFRVLALQESGFADDALLKNVAFSEVSTSEENEGSGERSVIFSLTGALDTGSILYDGSRVSAPQTSFLNVGDELIALDPTLAGSEVLGESITSESL